MRPRKVLPLFSDGHATFSGPVDVLGVCRDLRQRAIVLVSEKFTGQKQSLLETWSSLIERWG